MGDEAPRYELTFTCARHVQASLRGELAAMGFDGLREQRSGVRARASLPAAYRACLWSRTASRVLLTLGEGPAEDAEALYRTARAIDWSAHAGPESRIAVEATVLANPVFRQPHFAALRVKDAIVDAMRETEGARPSVDPRQPDLQFRVLVKRDRAVISLDLAGAPLHQRGYRLETGPAPLRETLAAALLQRCEWPRIAAEGEPFVDLMCGAGTLVIEAALMAGDVAPGLARTRWGFTAWRRHDAAAWAALLAQAQARRAAGLETLVPLFGFDTDRTVLRGAQANLARAGLADRVRLAPGDVRRGGYRLPGVPRAAAGLVMVNPPYGERLGEQGPLGSLYAALGGCLRREFAGWRAAVFTGNPPLGRELAMEADRTHRFMNGPIDCRLLQFRPVPPEPLPGPAGNGGPGLPGPMGRGGEGAGDAGEACRREQGGEHATGGAEAPPELDTPGARELANRLIKNARRLARWRRRNGVTCYRLYDGDLPEYRLAIDVYETVAQGIHVSLQEYAPPASVDAALAARRVGQSVQAVRSALSLTTDRVHVKRRRRQRGNTQYARLARRGRFLEVAEHGARLLVNLDDYLDTGLFLDHRPVRALIREQAAGKRFLNLFAYTGTATVAAALGGARRTTTVDMSRTYLDWAQRNLRLNLADAVDGPEHRFVQADVLAWLQAARHDAGRYDLMFVDPPSFSTSSRMTGTFDVQRDHVALLAACLDLLVPDGILLFSNNLRRFRFARAELEPLAQVEDITAATIGEDFARRPHIHHCFRLRRRAGAADSVPG